VAAHAARIIAVELLGSVLIDGHVLGHDDVAEATNASPSERARGMRLSRATLRNINRADSVLKPFLRKMPPAYVHNVMRLAVVEMHLNGDAPHGVIDDAVKLVKSHAKHNRMSGLANAVLRKTVDQQESWKNASPNSLPSWIARPVKAAFSKPAQKTIEQAHESQPPLDITLKNTSFDGFGDAGKTPSGSVRLPAGSQVSTLPGFDTGDWWVQDAAAALPARLFGDLAGKRALDLCAAPGGKTMQLCAMGAEVTALDASPKRTVRLRENLERAQLTANVVVADVFDWTPDHKFDAVLLDAPCSATGTIRRHPELPFVKGDEDLPSLMALQTDMLDRAAGFVADKGLLVFCTCSLLPAEGEEQARAFLKRNSSFIARNVTPKKLGIPEDWLTPEGGIRTRPDYWAESGGIDGFFMIALQKVR
jgi:16S rRNA (cytosine967-C5)-methyltransferase